LFSAGLFTVIAGVSVAPDDVTSLSATVPASAGGIAFTTTHWSVVLEAQGESPAAQEALENLCRTYWRPICGFVRREGIGPEEAKDLAQRFFALILERKDFPIRATGKGPIAFFSFGFAQAFHGERSAIKSRRRFENKTRHPNEIPVRTIPITSPDLSTHLWPGLSLLRGAGPSLGHRFARSPSVNDLK
jgi:hypothetical protein